MWKLLSAFKRAFGLFVGNWFEEVINLRTHLLQKSHHFLTQFVIILFPLSCQKAPNTPFGEKQECKQHWSVRHVMEGDLSSLLPQRMNHRSFREPNYVTEETLRWWYECFLQANKIFVRVFFYLKSTAELNSGLLLKWYIKGKNCN